MIPGAQKRRALAGPNLILALALALCAAGAAPGAQNPTEKPADTQTKADTQSTKDQVAEVPVPPPKGKKLILKDGSFQLVREYERKGDRVRYYSVERSAWEEIPADLVDWDATRKTQAQGEQRKQELVEKLRATEAAERAAPVDIDASIQVGPGLFLPPGEGMYVVERGAVLPLSQATADVKLDKGNLVKQILVPIPVVPTRHKVGIPGKRAQMRITTTQPEFYVRVAPPDADSIPAARTTSGKRSDRTREPEVELIRAQVKGDVRVIEFLRTGITGQSSTERKAVSLLRWEVTQGVYRLTLNQPLEPGEYALAEILPEGMNLYVWDFGVDPPAAKPASPQKTSP